MSAFLGKELSRTMYWKTTSSDLSGEPQFSWARSRNCGKILGPKPFPPDSAIARSSALSPAHVTTRADFCEKESQDNVINKSITDSFLPTRTTGHDPMFVKDSEYARSLKGPVGKQLRTAKQPVTDISEYNCLDFFLSGENLEKASWAFSQYGPPPPKHPTRAELFLQKENFSVLDPPKKADFYHSLYQHDFRGSSVSSSSGASSPGRAKTAPARSRCSKSMPRAMSNPGLPAGPTPAGKGGGQWLMSSSRFFYQDPAKSRSRDPTKHRQVLYDTPGRATVVTQ